MAAKQLRTAHAGSLLIGFSLLLAILGQVSGLQGNYEVPMARRRLNSALLQLQLWEKQILRENEAQPDEHENAGYLKAMKAKYRKALEEAQSQVTGLLVEQNEAVEILKQSIQTIVAESGGNPTQMNNRRAPDVPERQITSPSKVAQMTSLKRKSSVFAVDENGTLERRLLQFPPCQDLKQETGICCDGGIVKTNNDNDERALRYDYYCPQVGNVVIPGDALEPYREQYFVDPFTCKIRMIHHVRLNWHIWNSHGLVLSSQGKRGDECGFQEFYVDWSLCILYLMNETCTTSMPSSYGAYLQQLYAYTRRFRPGRPALVPEYPTSPRISNVRNSADWCATKARKKPKRVPRIRRASGAKEEEALQDTSALEQGKSWQPLRPADVWFSQVWYQRKRVQVPVSKLASIPKRLLSENRVPP